MLSIFFVSPVGAARAGRLYGTHAYAAGVDPDAAAAARLRRLFWRLQSAEARRCFALAFVIAWRSRGTP